MSLEDRNKKAFPNEKKREEKISVLKILNIYTILII